MSKSVDNRVVQMEFDNAAFEKGVAQTIHSLETLNHTIAGSESQSRLSDVFNRMGFNDGVVGKIQDITRSVSSLFGTIMDKFGLVAKVVGGVTALGSGGLIGMALTGGKNRALNIEQAKFMLKGLGHAWEEFADDIDYAVSGTRYGLDAAAKAAAQLVASGVEAGDGMKEALRGISGVASMTNSEYQEISDVFTRIAGQGRVMANDLNSLAARGLNAAGVLAKAMGTTEAEIRDMVSKGKIDFATFAHYMDERFGDAAKSANETFTGAMANARAALNRIGAEFYITTEMVIDGTKHAVGGLEMGRRIFAALIPLLNSIKATMGPVIQAWRETSYWIATGAEEAIDRFRRLFWYAGKDHTYHLTDFAVGLGEIFGKLKDAFGSVVEPLNRVRSSMKSLTPFSGDLYKDMGAIFAFVKPIRLEITRFVDGLKLGEGAIRLITAALQAMLNVVTPMFNLLFDNVGSGASSLITMFLDAKNAVDGVLGGMATVLESLLPKFSEFGSKLAEIPEKISNLVSKHGTRLVNFFESVKTAVDELLSEHGIEDLASWIGGKLSEAISTLQSYGQPVLDFLGELKDKVVNVFSEIGGGFLGGIFDGLTNFQFPGFDFFAEDSDTSAIDHLGEKVDQVGKNLKKNPLAKMFDQIGSSVSDFMAILDEGPAHLSDWRNMFGRIKDSISEFVSEVLPLEKAGETVQNFFAAMSGFGTDTFSGLGSLAGDNTKTAEFLDKISKAASDMFAQFKRGLPTADQLRGALDKVGEKLSEFLDLITPIGQKLGEAFGLAIQNAANFVGQLGEKFASMNFSLDPLFEFFDGIADALLNFFKSMEDVPLLDNVKNLFGDLSGALGSFVSDVAPKLGDVAKGIGEMFESFGGLDSIGGTISNLAGMFDSLNPSLERTADAMSTMSDAVTGPVDKISGGLEGLSKSVRDTGDSIQSVEDAFGNSDKGLGAKLQEMASGVNAGVDQMLPVAITGAFVWRAFTFTKTLQNFMTDTGGAIKKIGSLAESAKAITDKIGNNLKDSSSKLSLVRDIAIAFAVLAASLYLLTTVDTDKLWPAVGAMAVLGLIIGLLAAGLSLLTAKLKGFDAFAVQQIGLGMLALAAALGILAVGVKLLSNLEPEQVVPGLIAMGAGLAGLVVAAIVLSKWAPSMGVAGVGLLFMAGAIMALGAAAAFIAQQDLPSMAQGLIVVVAALAIFAGVGRLLGQGGRNMIQMALGLVILGGALLFFVGVAKVLTNTDWGSILPGLFAVAIGLVAFAALTTVLSKATVGILAAAGAMVIIAGAMIVMSIAFAVLGAAIDNMSNVGETAKTMAGLLIVLGVVAAALIAITSMAGVKAVATVGTILALSAALIVLTGALVILSALPADKLEHAATVLAILLGVITVFGLVASGATVGFLALSGAVLAISVATVIAGFGITMFVTALTVLGAVAPGVGEGVATAMQLIGDAMRSNGLEVAGFTALMIIGIAGLGVALVVASVGMIAFAVAILAVVGAIALAITAVGSLIGSFDMAQFDQIGGKMISGVVTGIQTAFQQFGGFLMGIGDAIGNFITGGINGNVEQVQAASESLATAAVEPTKEVPVETNAALQQTQDAFAKYMGEGGNIPDLVSGGMSGMLDSLGVSMDDLKGMLESGAIDGTALFGEGFDISSISTDQLSELVSNTEVDMSMIPAITGEAGAEASAEYASQFKMADVSQEEMQAAADSMASVNFSGPAKTKGQEGVAGLRAGFTGTRAIGLKGANELVAGVRSVDVSGPGRGAGSGIVSGMIAGLNALAPQVYARAEEIARTAANKAKSGAEVNSPSKITIPVGEAIGEGLIVGMNNIASTVNKTGEKLGRNSALAVRVASQMMDGIDWDAAPVIRPVLDTSLIASGMRDVNRLMAQQATLDATGYAVASPTATSMNSTVSNDIYNFNLDYRAGDDPNNLLLFIANAMKHGNKMRA